MVSRSIILGLGASAALALGAVVVAHPGHAPMVPPEATYTAHTAAVPFDLFRGSRIFLRGTVNGAATDMMLDSGAAATVIDAGFADMLGLKGGEPLSVRGAGGEVPGRIVRGVTLTAGTMTLRNLNVMILDMAPIARGIGRPLPVVLGRDAFRTGLVTIDFPGRTITFADRAHFAPPAGATRVALGGDGHLRSLKLSVAGLPPIDATLDLGNGGTILLSKAYWAGQPQLARLRSAETQIGGVGGLTLARKTTLPAVDFAGVRLTNVPAILNGDPEALPTRGGNVGIEMFKPFVVTFDDAGNAIYLRKVGAAQPIARERAGVRTELAGDRLKVAYVSPDGPAAHSGLKAGEEIVAIGGEKVTADYYRGSDWTRGAPGTPVVLQRADGTSVTVTLQDYF